MDTIRIDNLTKHYGDFAAISDLSLTVQPGAIFGFLGPNGAGKTTTIRVLLGFLRPSKGAAKILGEDCWKRSDRIKADIGYIPGDLRMYPWMTVRNALQIVGQVRRQDLRAAGLALAEAFELDPYVRVRNMSRGMRQKLGLLLTLVHNPKLLILDEPTSALDPPMQQRFYDHLRRAAEHGTTIFFSSHTLSEVETLCDRVAILREGRLVADEPLSVLKHRAERTVTFRWKGDAPRDFELPPFLKLEQREGARWRCILQGSAMDAVQWAASQPFEDFTLSPPDLDSLFRRFYREDEA